MSFAPRMNVLWVAMVLSGAGGCNDSAANADAGVAGDHGSRDQISAAGTFTATDGFSSQSLSVGGETRAVAIYAPASRGSQPPLLVAFHGTSGEPGDWISGNDPSGLEGIADANGFVIAAPRARDWGDGASDWDNHAGNDRYWETRFDSDPARGSDRNANADLLLVEQIIAAAHGAFNIDPKRVYLIGFSNGAFFSLHAAMILRDKIAAFAEVGGGLVTCSATADCSSLASTTSCSQIPSCPCSSVEKPTTIPTSGRLVPGILGHNSGDDTVSSFFTCALAARMQALGYDVSVHIADAAGHGIPDGFLDEAWTFFSTRRLP